MSRGRTRSLVAGGAVLLLGLLVIVGSLLLDDGGGRHGPQATFAPHDELDDPPVPAPGTDRVHSSPLDTGKVEMLEAATPTAYGEPAVVGQGAWTVLDVDLDARERLAELTGREPQVLGQIVMVDMRMEAAGDEPWGGDAHIMLIGGDDQEYFDLCGLPTSLTVYAGSVIDPGASRDVVVCHVLEPEAVEGARLVVAVPYEEDARPAVWTLR